MTGREEALADLLAPQAQEVVFGLLLSARDVKIAVPCSVLSKASATGSRVLVTPVRRSGLRDLAIDCGRWRGAPTTAVHMDYRQLLQHASDDAVRSLHKKLTAITRSRGGGLARTQSVPGRALFQDSGSSGSGGSSRLHRTSSTGLPPSGLQRTSSSGLPPSGHAGLRRTSSVGLPSTGGNSVRSSSSHIGAGLHRLSGSAQPRSESTSFAASSLASSLACSPAESEDELITPEKLAQAAAEASSELAAATPAAVVGMGKRKATGVQLSFEDSAGPRPARSAAQPLPGAPPQGGSWDGWQQGSPTSPGGLSVELSGGSIAALAATPSSPFASTPLSASPAITCSSQTPSPGDGQGLGADAGGTLSLSRQPTFSQPYFAELEGEAEAEARAAAAAGLVTPQAASAEETTPPHAAPDGRCRTDSGSTRAAQLLAAQDQMTAEELHEVAASFNHVFVPPWAVPQAPEQQTVATYREAAVQTSTGAAGQDSPVPLRSTHTAEDAADHFQAFMQHFSASLPHLAMALADMHLVRGGEDPTFIKSQFYFNNLLLLRDEMRQLEERLAPAEASK
ncbi:hypothetical protein ABPG75_006518 [Micractinium tetrahymenae]